ncbi:hypothetical protein [Mycobacterium sherrisii]|uniref:tRNA(Ile2) 2-agmatinylcytidine synthetase n=1 Tax=Mycobacterium sherrisii TaxID=243061 RepID=A0A1E3SNE6_9MYCO|nr:hypothetical protein [Mycobacterium sherrisii]MCV7027666.1 hypothetical protein [Mycobacterium sherrisii]MEC4764822.1 hypothetical protein [Mycobacterium sherrisii]ODR03661.1 hypothetical protein BHQ21_21025 [Mycobacterium sherrisii]ORW72512.1 hypothetical protein AWC25_18800 [Mycobacterium sherrisii]
MTGGTALAGVDLLVGIDDTDNPYTPGTGRRARALLHELQAAGLGSPAGATRHQLLVDDRIAYTSHNSSACLAWRSPDGDPHAVRTAIIELAGQFLERVCPPDADPGLAVIVASELSDAAPRLIEFGRRAKQEVLHPNEAPELGAALGVHLSGHGGTREGMTGALAAVGLHLSGNDGLFITLPGIRKLPDQATVETVFAMTPIDLARDAMHRQPRSGEVIELGDWVRPVLLDGQAVLLLEPPGQQADGSRTWRTAPRAVVKQY